jgi:histidinol-phosphate phosphatase family protein
MNKAVFIDRDGTIARDVNYCRHPDDFEILPGVCEGIRLLNENKFLTIVITNQSGLARAYFTEEILENIHNKMRSCLAMEGAHIDAIYYCPHHPDSGCDCRKPSAKLAYKAISDFEVSCEHSYVIGDRLMDVQLARNIGCKAIMIDNERGRKELTGHNIQPDYIATDMIAAAEWVIKHSNSF